MLFHELTSPRLAKVDRQQSLVIVPIAAVEQHGPHLPTGTDTIICTAVAEAVERARPAQILLTPTQWLGASAHHLRLGATLDAGLDNYIYLLEDIARSLLEDGFRRILLLNGHGGNIDPMRVALRGLQTKYVGALLAAGCYWGPADDLLNEVLDGSHKFVGHACEFETSLIQFLRPELVDDALRANAGELVADQLRGVFLSRDMRQRTRQGCTGRPDLASADKGRRLFEGLVTRVVAVVDELLSQPLGTEYRDFILV
jgi:creatinine amidohydrolase